VIQVVAERRGPEGLALGLDAIPAISRWIAVPATLVVGVTGIFQLVDGPYSLGDSWLVASLGLYLAVMVVAVVYLAPAYTRAREAALAGSRPIDVEAVVIAAVAATVLAAGLIAASVLTTPRDRPGDVSTG
jgi:uncharacterized membrane protein